MRLHGLSWVVGFLIGSSAVRAQQAPFQTPISAFSEKKKRKNGLQLTKICSTIDSQAYDHGLFSPVEDLSILSETEFTTLSHPLFPRHSVRVKKSSFCDETVQWASSCLNLDPCWKIFPGLSLGILILKLDICFSTSLRVGVILIKMMLYSGPTEVILISTDSHKSYILTLCQDLAVLLHSVPSWS